MSPRRNAFIDVGTNTALLLVADLEPVTGRIVTVDHRQTIVRLGEKVDERDLNEFVAGAPPGPERMK